MINDKQIVDTLNAAAAAEIAKLRQILVAKYHDYLDTAGNNPLSYNQWKEKGADHENRG